MPSLRAVTARPFTWSWCSWVMTMALRVVGFFPGQLHAPEELAATQAGIDEDARAAAGENRAVALRPRRQHREAHHGLSIQSRAPVENLPVPYPSPRVESRRNRSGFRLLGRKEPRMKSHLVPIFLLACAAMAPTLGPAQEANSPNPAPVPLSTPFVYHNTRYGFCFLLPADWKRVHHRHGKVERNCPEYAEEESGPQLLIRNPKWTKDDPWQDIPIMIFTPSQWKLVAAENMAVSAALLVQPNWARIKAMSSRCHRAGSAFTTSRGLMKCRP